MSLSKIVVLGTGGTIAGTAISAEDNIGYTAAQVGVLGLLEAIPSLRGQGFETEQVAQVDSKDMGFDIWLRLAQRCAHWLAQDETLGIVITHGTDTLEETAFFLQSVLCPAKPVVLTCAMRPSTAISPDGPQNLLDAMAVARSPEARGVVAVCAGKIHGAMDVQKVHPYRLDAFSSGDCGVVGYVEEGKVRRVRAWPQAPVIKTLATLAATDHWPRVEIVMSYAGASGAGVRALVDQGVAGIVVAATGNGTLHRDLEKALRQAQAVGVKVVRTTRCSEGRILGDAAGGLPESGGLSPVKARIALMLELMA
ncbi:MAG: asparaginase [Burkholderiaceae bacterium]|nr:asparaginase [Burkholderiaceae bacterium]